MVTTRDIRDFSHLRRRDFSIRQISEITGWSRSTVHLHLTSREKDKKFHPKTIKTQIPLTTEKAYVLGVLCGDGYLYTNHRDYTIRLAVNDKDFAEEFSRNLEIVYGLKPLVYSHNYRCIVELRSKEAYEDIAKFGNFRTYTWRVPNEIVVSRDETIRASFLRGFFDSEGSVAKYSIGCCSVNKEGLIEIKQILESLGIRVGHLSKDGLHHRIYICDRLSRVRFYKIVGFSIKRKEDKLRMSLGPKRIELLPPPRPDKKETEFPFFNIRYMRFRFAKHTLVLGH